MTNRRLLNVLGLMVVLLAIVPALTASSAGRWSQATNMSDWQDALEPHWMRIVDDGTQVVYWIAFEFPSGKGAIHARVRPPGGSWGQVEDITGWMTGTCVPGVRAYASAKRRCASSILGELGSKLNLFMVGRYLL